MDNNIIILSYDKIVLGLHLSVKRICCEILKEEYFDIITRTHTYTHIY